MSKLTFVSTEAGEINVFWMGKIVGTLDAFYTEHALVSIAGAIQQQNQRLRIIASDEKNKV